VHQDHVTRRCSVLDDLQRYSINHFGTFVEPGDTRSRIASGTQISEVRVLLQGSPVLRTLSPFWRRILRKPLMHETMRSAKDVRAATTWSDVGQHRMYLHATGGQKSARVIAIKVPASARYIPFTPGRELQEEGTPITRSLPRLAFQHFIDRADRTRAPDSTKSRVALQVLQAFRSRLRPS